MIVVMEFMFLALLMLGILMAIGSINRWWSNKELVDRAELQEKNRKAREMLIKKTESRKNMYETPKKVQEKTYI